MKQTKSLFTALTRNENSILYGADRMTKHKSIRQKRLTIRKEKVYLGFYRELKDENELYFDKKKLKKQGRLPFIEQQKDIDWSSTL